MQIDVLTVPECVEYWGSTVNSEDIVCVYDLAGGNNGEVGGCSVSQSLLSFFLKYAKYIYKILPS